MNKLYMILNNEATETCVLSVKREYMRFEVSGCINEVDLDNNELYIVIEDNPFTFSTDDSVEEIDNGIEHYFEFMLEDQTEIQIYV